MKLQQKSASRKNWKVEIDFQDENHGCIAGIYSDMEVNQYKKNIYVTEDGGKTFVLTGEGQPR